MILSVGQNLMVAKVPTDPPQTEKVMKFLRTLPFVLALVFALIHDAKASEPLVSADWLLKNYAKPGLALLDVRHAGVFSQGTVPGAVNADYGRLGWRVERKGIPAVLPKMENLQSLIRGLGVSNDDHIIIMPGGYSAGEMGVATRIYWTFKVAGHDEISILNGGINAYFSLKKPAVSKGISKPIPSSYEVKFRPELLATSKDVNMALANKSSLIDNRPHGQYLGINKSSSLIRTGTLKNAVNVSGQWLTVNDGGTFRSTEVLTKLFEKLGASNSGPVINFCNTGHWASLGWFVTHELMENSESKLYDGSMAEWGRDPKNPVEVLVPLN